MNMPMALHQNISVSSANQTLNAARSRLRSAAHGDLQVPRSKTNFDNRAFAVTRPTS